MGRTAQIRPNVPAAPCRCWTVHFERLVIEAGDSTFTLDLHPRLTVIAGVGRLEREGLVSELVGALSASRPGVHLELEEDSGRHLAVFRPHGARHRVVDVEQGLDISSHFATADGSIDLLARAGLDPRSAKRHLRLSASDLSTSSQSDQLIRDLAAVDQAALWAAADHVTICDEQLQAEADATGSTPEDAAVVEEIESRHATFLRAQEAHDRVRRLSFFTAAFATLGAIPLSILEGPTLALPFVLFAAVATGISMLYWRRMENARAKENDVLEQAGATSYLGFHLQRVNGLLATDQNRRRLMEAAEAYREALAGWEQVAGPVQVQFAVDHHEEIMAAARMRRDVGAAALATPAIDNDLTSGMAHALIGRLAQLRAVGPRKESFPLVLDDPFVELDTSVKPSLLELLGRAAAHQQIIYLTEDEDVASWAKIEALTGDLAILEPSASEPPPLPSRRSARVH